MATRFLRISSISDVITNSSTEVFMMRDNEETAKVVDKVKSSEFFRREFKYIRNEKDLGDYLKELAEGGRLYLLSNCPLVCENILFDEQRLWEIDKRTGESYLGNTWEKTFQYFKQPYLPLIGHVIIDEDNCYTDTWGFGEIREECMKWGNCVWEG